MSRLIIKNLPSNVTETKLKEHFSTKGVVTDVQLKYTKDGKFRRFGFVGFKTDEQANEALEYFDKTCIDTTRISVQLCAGLGDPSKPKSWSKYTEKTVEKKEEPKKPEKKKKEKKTDNVKKVLDKYKDEPMFKEFLESHAPKGINEIWSNDTETGTNIDSKKDSTDDDNDSEVETSAGADEEINVNKSDVKIANEKISDSDYMAALKGKKEPSTDSTTIDKTTHGPTKFYTVKMRGLGYNHKKKHIKKFFQPLKPKSIRVPQKIKGIAYVGFKSEWHMNQALNKDRTFLESKQIFVTKYEAEKEKLPIPKEEDTNSKWQKQEEALKNEEPIAESGRIFVRNLAYTTTEDDLRSLFVTYGPLAEVNLPVDKISRKPKGFGTVEFMMPEHAARAHSELDGTSLNGRMLHILPGKSKVSLTDRLQEEGLTFKEKKELERRATANSTHNWNTLFLGQNAVVDAIASTYNTTKENIFETGGKGTSVAVRLALGETQLVEETKKFLEENGVKLDAFNQAPEKRSNTVIIVKNLPIETKSYELREKFAAHGELGRLIMPPSGITALIEFLEPSEARKAFTRLAYTKFKHLPLYLEWAPDNSLTPCTKQLTKQLNDIKSNNSNDKSIISTEVSQSKNDTEDEDEPEPDTTLFVKNLNFSTTDDDFKKYFSKCGVLHYANVVTKKDPNNPGEKLSMGYGFVRYKYKNDADRALKQLQMTELDGKTLELKRSERTLATDVVTTRKTSKVTAQTGTKILIRNIPFQANADEITELFKAFGELKAVRLPKKAVGDEQHRGFGFAEYYTKSEAKRAFKALCQSTHLYGRRLVLEWAQTIEDVDDIRKRTAKHFHQELPNKKSKKATLDLESVGLAAE